MERRRSWNGYQAAEKIREKDALVPIVFLTNCGDYAIKGYRLNAYRYLLKSNYQEELEEIIQKLHANWKEDQERVVLKTSHGGWEAKRRRDWG